MSMLPFSDPFYADPSRGLSPIGESFAFPPVATGRLVDTMGSLGSLGPQLDIHENKESGLVIATFTLPNTRKGDIPIDIVDDQLVVTWNTATQTDVEGNGLVIQQSKRSEFSRSILLPPGTRAEDVKAMLKNGVLTVTYPKGRVDRTSRRRYTT